MSDRIYNAIILNEPYAGYVFMRKKRIETRMRRLSKLVGDIVICCDKGVSKNSLLAGKALCIVSVGHYRVMTKVDETEACIEWVEGRIAYDLSDWRYFSYSFNFTDYKVGGTYQGVFQIRIPDFVQILPISEQEDKRSVATTDDQETKAGRRKSFG